MSSIRETAQQFFDACESGKGWEECGEFCHPGATFSAQAEALASIDTLESYAEWMKGILTPIPDGAYDVGAFAVDEDRASVIAFSTFRGTHTGPGGPQGPTGQGTETEYVYVMKFDGDKISHMTKVWNDGVCLKQLGWA